MAGHLEISNVLDFIGAPKRMKLPTHMSLKLQSEVIVTGKPFRLGPTAFRSYMNVPTLDQSVLSSSPCLFRETCSSRSAS